MHTFTLPIGDWSDDGHGKCEHYTIQCSHSADDCRKAYLKSCRLSGYQFHHPSGSKGVTGIPLLAEYQDNVIAWTAVASLMKFGLDIRELVGSPTNDGEDIDISYDEIPRILMEFIGLSLEGMTWETVARADSLFGYWNKDLNVQMGYGCFE